ncbi:MAG: response regulator [Deltaproteobacteria bacterium]|nr:response regulator [Deltaproteobacteria bacterium]MBF0525623.1 response regulator [Deltaproteobacteria bacterium]
MINKKIGSVLVVGAGISGIRAALDLAEFGYQVMLIDKAPHIGGTLTQLDYQFPSDHCGMCKMLPLVERDASSQYCLRKGLFHRNISLSPATSLVGLEGEPGNFQATLSTRQTLVDPAKCSGCGACADVCPVVVPDEFNAGLTNRKAVYLPVPHNIPNHYVIDGDKCTLCGACVQACPTGAIDLQLARRKEFRILVVDDELIVRDSLKEWLAEEGFSVDMAESGPAALAALARNEYNLMLLDIKMPGMDGVETLKQAKELKPNLPIVMMTAYATVETAVEAMKLGASDYLMKPFDPDTLVHLIFRLYQDLIKTGEVKLTVGAIVLATGFKSYDPAGGDNPYLYGLCPNVVTAVEFERMISGSGPHPGRLTRPGDGGEVNKIAWLQCVGSRNIREDKNFCSSICCMYAVKEARLAKELSDGKVDTAIFYMDMRTHGKNFQRYRDKAEQDLGVRFVRSRVHSLGQSDNQGPIKISYIDPAGEKHEEEFDLVVLSTGQMPAAEAGQLAEITGCHLNHWGFFQSQGFSLCRTSREGIFLAGSASGARDISESVVQANAAALAASSLIHGKGGGLTEVSSTKVEYRDVSKELPKTFVAVCGCGQTLTNTVDITALNNSVNGLPSVERVYHGEKICVEEGWNELVQELRQSNANRVLIAACNPYLYTRKAQELARQIDLSPALIEVVDIRTPAFSGAVTDRKQHAQNITRLMAMGLARLREQESAPVRETHICQKALVLGGGIAGMTAALAIAAHGFEVMLVEQTAELGGNLRHLHWTLSGESPDQLLAQTIAKIQKNPLIHVYEKAKVVTSVGHVGRYLTTIEKADGQGETLEHGVTVIATGGLEAQTTSYAYGQSPAIMTQHEFEARLHDGQLTPDSLKLVAMIQCVDSREEPRNYCSRVCCAGALKNALYLKEKNPKIGVVIFYRDFMSHGFMEAQYTEAREKGVILFQYQVDRKPVVTVHDGRVSITVRDIILDRDVLVEPDALVLSTGIRAGDNAGLAQIFQVNLDQDGFFVEAESKWRPVDSIREGLFFCGLAQSPRSLAESVATGEAAAMRALRILKNESLAAGYTVAEIRQALCSLCEKCISACPYGARSLDEETGRINVDELMCQGCGACAAVCPNGASILRGQHDKQVFYTIDAALQEVF